MPQPLISKSLLTTFALLVVAPNAFGADLVRGRIVTPDGEPIAGALVLTPRAGWEGWAESEEDGAFQLSVRETFIGVQHRDFVPRIVRVPDSPGALSIVLQPAEGRVRALPACPEGEAALGGRLSIPTAGLRHRGPIFGEDATYWEIHFDDANKLEIASGGNEHDGLPLESWLVESSNLTVKGWVYGERHGIDVTGETADGKRWRWFAAIVSDVIRYSQATPEAARYFDSVTESVCVVSR